MPIDSIAGLRHLSQAQGSFVRLDQSTDKLQTTTAKARFWQLSQRSQEKAGNRAAAERVRDSVCAYCGKAEGTRLFNQYIGKKSLEGKAFTGGNLSRLLDAAAWWPRGDGPSGRSLWRSWAGPVWIPTISSAW